MRMVTMTQGNRELRNSRYWFMGRESGMHSGRWSVGVSATCLPDDDRSIEKNEDQHKGGVPAGTPHRLLGRQLQLRNSWKSKSESFAQPITFPAALSGFGRS